MQHSPKRNTTNQMLKITNIKLRDINSLTSSQTAKIWDRCRSQEYWSHNWDELLCRRSAYEFVRDQLTPEQLADLDQIDAFWHAHPQAFNQAFVNEHHRANHQTELEGYVQDQHGNTPAIPKSHWWWRPLKEDNT